LILLILLDEIEDSSGECASYVRCWLYRDVWALDWTKNIIDHTDLAKFVVADLGSECWDWWLVEPEN